jgi:hypothetical protein
MRNYTHNAHKHRARLRWAHVSRASRTIKLRNVITHAAKQVFFPSKVYKSDLFLANVFSQLVLRYRDN